MKNKLSLGILIAALSGASLSADLISAKSDGIMQLPVFYVYASDSEETVNNSIPVNTDWKFQKSLDFGSEPVFTTIVGPGDEEQSVSTPSIRTSLINTDIVSS